MCVKRIKYLLILLLITICFSTTYLAYRSYLNKNIKEDNYVSNKNDKMFAIYVRDDTGNYVESSNFPKGSYKLNNELTVCNDNNGDRVENVLSYSNGFATVTSKKTIFCYLYFEPKVDLIINVTNETVPKTSGYSVVSTCPNSSWSDKYQRLELGDISNPTVECNLTYNKRTFDESKKLSTIASTEGTSGKGSIVNEGDAGYRYEGQDPNNYIWFNNELWRIIGVIPTKVDSSGTTENLVKIIRNESIGGLAYDAKSSGYTGKWGSNTLYSLLNEYYFGKKDGTNTTGCYGHQATAKAKCDYTKIGLEATDYYGEMVKKVYWNTGANDYNITAGALYEIEKATQTVYNYVGLMNASDYGYATSASHSTKISSYDNATHSLNNWLYGHGLEWTNTESSSSAAVLLVTVPGSVHGSRSYYGYTVRPVLYLRADIYVSSGDGSKAASYVISKKLK